MTRRPKPAPLQAAVTVAAVLVLLATYTGVMHLAVDVSRPELYSVDYRDQVYFWIHLGGMGAAVAIGFILGKWMNGLGFAYATLFLFAVAAGMAGIQLGSHALACQGRNDVVRHWVC